MDIVLTARPEPEDGRAFDAFVARGPTASFAQLRDYGTLAAASRPFSPYVFLARERGEIVGAALVLRSTLGPLGLPFAQVERGPVVAAPERLSEVLVHLRRALLARGIVRLSVMPYLADDDVGPAERTLADLGYHPIDDPAGAHVRTLRMPIDAPNEADVFAGSERKTLRYELKQAKKLGVRTDRVRGDGCRAFFALMDETLSAQGKPSPKPAFAAALGEVTGYSERVACFVSRDDERDLGGVVVVRTDTRLHLAHGATSLAKRPYSKMSPPLAAAITWARSFGARELDLGGVPHEDDTDPKRNAIAAFKHGFSKTRVRLCREHVRWL